jgi:hypothetical protein
MFMEGLLMTPDSMETKARERIEGLAEVREEVPEPLPIHPELVAHMSEADQYLCSGAMWAVKIYLASVSRGLENGSLLDGPARWAGETLIALANVIERARESRNAAREEYWEARWEAGAPLRAAHKAEGWWIQRWVESTAEGKEWQARLEVAPSLIAYHELRWEASALYARWQEAEPEAASRLLEDAALALAEFDRISDESGATG